MHNGKTHLATAIGVKAVSEGRSVRFHSTADLVMRLERAQGEGSLDRALRDATSADLVMLDEFGYVPIDVAGARILFQVVSDCYERRSLIVTTNIEFSKWGTVLGDDKLAAAMIDRLCEASHKRSYAERFIMQSQRKGTQARGHMCLRRLCIMHAAG